MDRKNSRGGSLFSIYTDIVNPVDHGFEVPSELNGRDHRGRIMVNGLFENKGHEISVDSSTEESCSSRTEHGQ